MTETTSPPTIDWRTELLTRREATLRQLYAQTFPMVAHYVRQHHGDAPDAKDIFHDALIVFYEKVIQPDFAFTSAPSTYIMGIAKRMWLKELQKRGRFTGVLDEEETNEPSWEEANDDPAPPLMEYVEKLGEACKNLLVDFYYAGQSLSQIATTYGYRTVHSATVQKYKCLERLRKSVRSLKALFA